MKKIKLVIYAIIMFSLFSCSDGVSDLLQSEPEIIIPKTTKPIAIADFDNNFISISSDSTTLTFDSSINSIYNFNKGDIIVSQVGNGLLKKIVSIQKSGKKISLTTIPAAITEAIEKGSGKFSEVLNSNNILKISSQFKGIEIVRNSLSKTSGIHMNINIRLFDGDNDTMTTGDQVRLKGSIELGPKINGEFVINSFKLKKFKVEYIFTENVDLNIEVGLLPSGTSLIDLLKKKIATLKVTPPITILVGGVPVVIVPAIEIFAGIQANANSSISTGITQNISFSVGLLYEGGKWQTFKNQTNDMSYKPIQLNASVSIKGYIKPELQMRVYDVLSPYLKTELYAKVEADINKNPWWELYGGLTVGAGMKMSIWQKNLFDVGYDLFDFKIKLSEATTAVPKITVTSPNGGEEWIRGTSKSITWTDNIDENVKIELYKNGSYDRLITSSTVSDGSYMWSIPSNISSSTSYKVKIASVNSNSLYDYSNNNFTIRAADNITLTSPNGGESWQQGTTHTIAWNDNISENVKIELYKNGSFNSTISSSTTSDGSYSWTVPSNQTVGSNYKIKITSVNNSSLNDYSDNNFTINIPPNGSNNIIISSTPSGASVYLDGTDMNVVTPNTLTNAAPGQHHIRLYKQGYNEYNKTFTLIDGTNYTINANLGIPLPPLPYFTITNPNNGASYSDNVISVSGSIQLKDSQGNVSAFTGNSAILTLNDVDQVIEVINGQFNQEISIIAGENKIQLRANSPNGDTGISDEIIIYGNFSLPDIEITLSWNTATSDIDLHVWNPLGEHCYFSNKQISDGFLDVDDRDGYGPEIFTSQTALNGTYLIQVNSYDLNSDSYSDATVQVKLNGVEKQTFGPHRFNVSDKMGSNPDAWWEVYSFTISGGNISNKLVPISNAAREKIIRDMSELKFKKKE